MSKLILPTIDPVNGGGVASVLDFAVNTSQESGLEPLPVYNTQKWERCVRLHELIYKNASIKPDDWKGNQTYSLSRRFPESEVISYVSNYDLWNRFFESGRKIMGIGGTCLPCLPAALASQPFSCWVGTSLIKERETQVNQFNPIRKARYVVEKPILKMYERYIFHKATRILAQSEYAKESIIDAYSIDSEKIYILPFPIDVDKYKPKRNTKRKEIIFVGRLNDPRKNIRFLIESFALVVERLPNAHLSLIGGELSNEYQNLIDRVGIRSNITIYGMVKDIVPHLSKATVFAFPSKQEGLGIAGLEAMSCGTPVVSTKCGGPEDYIIEGYNGYLVDFSKEIFAERLVGILSDDELIEEMRQNARETVLKNYNAAMIRDKYIDHIKKTPKIE